MVPVNAGWRGRYGKLVSAGWFQLQHTLPWIFKASAVAVVMTVAVTATTVAVTKTTPTMVPSNTQLSTARPRLSCRWPTSSQIFSVLLTLLLHPQLTWPRCRNFLLVTAPCGFNLNSQAAAGCGTTQTPNPASLSPPRAKSGLRSAPTCCAAGLTTAHSRWSLPLSTWANTARAAVGCLSSLFKAA